MKQEVEIRFQVTENNIKTIESFLIQRKIDIHVTHQKDIYYCPATLVDVGKTEQRDYILRVRVQKGKLSELAFKAFSGKTSWIEIETGITNPKATIDILSHIGQKSFLTIDKKRRSAMVDGIEINVDEIKDLGNFVELEIMSDNELQAKKALYEFLKKKLGIVDAIVIEKGYVHLMESKQKSNPKS